MTDPTAASLFGAWLNHASAHYKGAFSFLIVDCFLLSGAAALAIAQAFQVRFQFFRFHILCLFGLHSLIEGYVNWHFVLLLFVFHFLRQGYVHSLFPCLSGDTLGWSFVLIHYMAFSISI